MDSIGAAYMSGRMGPDAKHIVPPRAVVAAARCLVLMFVSVVPVNPVVVHNVLCVHRLYSMMYYTV